MGLLPNPFSATTTPEWELSAKLGTDSIHLMQYSELFGRKKSTAVEFATVELRLTIISRPFKVARKRKIIAQIPDEFHEREF